VVLRGAARGFVKDRRLRRRRDTSTCGLAELVGIKPSQRSGTGTSSNRPCARRGYGPALLRGGTGSSVASNECIDDRTGRPPNNKEPCIVLENVVCRGAYNAACLARSTYSGEAPSRSGREAGRSMIAATSKAVTPIRPLCRLGRLWLIRCAPASCPRRKSYRRC
jgi:hypothetical protein